MIEPINALGVMLIGPHCRPAWPAYSEKSWLWPPKKNSIR